MRYSLATVEGEDEAPAANGGHETESRFDLACVAAHALALAALRQAGYRSGSRHLVFQVLAHALEMPPARWRVLAKCHELRNGAEHEGVASLSERLLSDPLAAARAVFEALRQSDPRC